MKKSELKDLVERKKILKESMDIINEVGGFDDPELMSQYHGNYLDELTKTFFHFDSLSDSLLHSLEKVMDEEERAQGKEILRKYVDFMDEYINYLSSLREKVTSLSKKTTRTNLPGMGNIGMNEDLY